MWRINLIIFKKESFHPAVLFAFIWFFIITFHLIIRYTVLEKLFPISLATYVVFFVGVVCFTLGAALQTLFTPADQMKEQKAGTFPKANLRLNKYFCLVCTIVVGIGGPFFIKACYDLFLLSSAENFLEGVRTEICFGDVDIGPTKYFMTLSFIVFALNSLLYFTSTDKFFSRSLLILSLLFNIIYIIFATGRIYFIMTISIYFGICYLYSKEFSLKRVLVVCVSFLFLFSIIGIAIYAKGGSANNTLQENISSAVESISIYAFTPLDACGILIDDRKPDNTGDRTLRVFKKFSKQTGFNPNAVVRPIIENYVFVPYPTNVYSLYSPYLEDFGKLYAWLAVGLFGFLHTYCYNKLKAHASIRLSLYYVLLLFPLFMSFFADQYFSLFSMWIQIVIIVEILCFANRIFNRYSSESV
jgi:oligosaccharide repeat unit polymerase